MFTIKYKPINCDSFIGNKTVLVNLENWLQCWKNEKPVALLSGPCGIGKSLLANLVLEKYNYNVMHISLDSVRDFANVILPFLKTVRTWDNKKNAVIVYHIDCDSAHLLDCFKNTKIPILCTCNNKYESDLKPLLAYCTDFIMGKPTFAEVSKMLNGIVTKEKLKKIDLFELYEQSTGDIRYMLNSLQMGLANQDAKENQSANIFETTNLILSAEEELEKKYKIFEDLHMLMVQENYVANIFGAKTDLQRMEHISVAADALSEADWISQQGESWEVKSYADSLVLKAASKCNTKVSVKFSQFFTRQAERNKKKAVASSSDAKPVVTKKVVKKKAGIIKKKVVVNEKAVVEEKAVVAKVEEKEEKVKKPRGRPKKVIT